MTRRDFVRTDFVRTDFVRTLALTLMLGGAAALPATAMQTPGGAPPAAEDATADADWRVETNAQVAEANHWVWRVRSLERRGDTLIVGVSYRNGASNGRPIFLEEGHLESVALVDDENGTRFELISVDGISEQIEPVERKSSKFARFTFRFPEGADSVTFTSRWMSMRMAGALAIMDVDFPIALPPADAGPI